MPLVNATSSNSALRPQSSFGLPSSSIRIHFGTCCLSSVVISLLSDGRVLSGSHLLLADSSRAWRPIGFYSPSRALGDQTPPGIDGARQAPSPSCDAVHHSANSLAFRPHRSRQCHALGSLLYSLVRLSAHQRVYHSSVRL